jgi:capsular exopolysaccharide synthesis family protein
MGKTYEALDRAEKDFQKARAELGPDAENKFMPALLKRSRAKIASCRVVDLKTKLLTRYTAEAVKSILVTGTAHGSGTSTTAISLATALAKDSRRKVLLADANLRTPGLHDVFKIEYTDGVYDLLNKENGHSLNFRRIGPGDLFLLPSGVNRAMENGYFESPRFDELIRSTRKSFDYVILDSAPITGFPDSQTICARVDGVILVIEAGITRRQVALRAKKELEDAGGRLLGVVLNRRKYYIPKWIYKRL